MKILLIDHAKKHFREQQTGRWHFLPYYFEKLGHEVLHVTKKDWKKFPFLYARFKPEVIIATGFAAILPLKMKRLGLIKTLIIYDWNDYWNELLATKLGIEKAAKFEAYCVENSDFLITPSRYLASKAEVFGKKAELILHGSDLNFKLKPKKLHGKFKVLYIGEQTPYKHVDRIIKAVKGLQCELYLIGKPNEELQATTSKNVHFINQVPHNEILSYIKAADVCVCTADQENLKMYEYAKAGKAILAYNGRIAYFLKHLETAYLTEDLREGLQVLMKNSRLRKNLADNVKKIKISSWQEIAKTYLTFLNNKVLK